MSKKIFYSIVGLFLSISTWAQVDIDYKEPPNTIVELTDATIPTASFSPNGELMLLLQNPGFERIENLATEVLGIAGLKFNPSNNALEEEFSGGYKGIQVKTVKANTLKDIEGLPKDFLARNIQWSPDNSLFAFTNKTKDGVELWTVDVNTLRAKKLVEDKVNGAYGTTYQWHPNKNLILVQTVPNDRGDRPKGNPVPDGPIVQENLGTETPSRTYQYLLENKHDETLMDYYLTASLKEIDMNGNAKTLYSPSIFRSFSYSPDGNYILIETVEKPYSYLVPIYLFPFHTSVLDSSGNLIKTLNKSPLADQTPISFDAVASGPRSFGWRGDAPSTIIWVEALDEGDPFKEVEHRDALFTLKAPFTGDSEKLFEMELRYRGVTWANEKYAVINEGWRRNRRVKTTLFNPEDGSVVKLIRDGSSEQTYTDPGRFVTDNTKGRNVMLLDKSRNPVAFTIGDGASPQGERPFLLKWDLVNNKKDTLFKSNEPYYEKPVFFNNEGYVYFSRESNQSPSNFFSKNLRNKKETALTQTPNPYPALKNVKTSLLSYKRADGIPLSGTLYLPEDFKEGDDPLPVLIWAYPREYKSAAAAGQVKGSPYKFPQLAFRSPVFWVTQGYAVVDDAGMPIVGEGDKEPNDTFLEQLEANAVALIDHIVDLGVADRDRIGIGGHSYGAFMTANLLAHTDLFAAGIARSGAYNRTLTPFGFQGESRTYWQAPDVYYEMSPFSYADKIKTPILITHGAVDDNSGTFPVQSERLYSAIKGHGGTVRLVMLPKEFHGYRSRESVLHTFWEQHQWLETYVKNRKK